MFAALLIGMPASVPTARADHDSERTVLSTLEGTFELDFTTDCAFRDLTAAGDVRLEVYTTSLSYPPATFVHMYFGGEQRIDRRGTCPDDEWTYDWDLTVVFDDSYPANELTSIEVDPATGAFSGSAIISYRVEGIGRDCLAPPGKEYLCAGSYAETEVDLSQALTVDLTGTVTESGMASAQMTGEYQAGRPDESLISGSFQANGPAFSFPTAGTSTSQPESPECPARAARLAARPLALAGPGFAQTPAEVDLAIGHVEVVQVVQNAEGSVTLVAGKSTAVRVIVTTPPDVTEPVGARVELTAVTEGGVTYGPEVACILASPGAFRNAIRDNEAIFYPPSALTVDGTVEFKVSADLTGSSLDPVPQNNEATLQRAFEPVATEIGVGYVTVCMGVTDEGRAFNCPTEVQVKAASAWSRMPQKLFPIRDSGLKWYRLPGPVWGFPANQEWTPPGLALPVSTQVLLWLRDKYTVAEAVSERALGPRLAALAGLARADTLPGTCGDAVLGSSVAIMPMECASRDGSDMLAFHLGRIWGLSRGSAVCDPRSAAIGEIGLDIDMVRREAEVVDATTPDLMSNCAAPRWISPAQWETILDQLPSADGQGALPSDLLALADGGSGLLPDRFGQTAVEYIVVAGVVKRDGSEGAIGPTTTVPSRANVDSLSSEDGRFCLELSGTTENVRRCFEPTFADPQTGATLDVEAFSFVLPKPVGSTRLSLTADGRELDGVDAGPDPPSVSAESRAGEMWAESRDIEWSVAGAGEEPVNVTVLYSPDGGSLWLPYAPDLATSNVTVDPTQLVAGDTNMFRILASAGLHTSSVDIGPISVPATVGRASLTGGEADAPTTPPSATEDETIQVDPLVALAVGAVIVLFLVLGVASKILEVNRKVAAESARWPTAAPAAPPPAPASGYGPSHYVPSSGLAAWGAPGAGGPPTQWLPPGQFVTVVEWLPTGWARVVTPNGWSGWVEGRLLLRRS